MWLTVLVEGATAATLVVPILAAGLWLVPLLVREPVPLRWHFLIGGALGAGLTSLLVLATGLAGVLNRAVWVALLGGFALLGTARLWVLLRRGSSGEGHHRVGAPIAGGSTGEPGAGRWHWLWLVVCPFVVLALLAAANAPGFIWREEGFAYDVLEYHLQLPKEYVQAGRIAYLPHNVYANFPANVEMLYLLAMIVWNDTLDIGVVANMIHLMLAVMTVYAAWVIGRDWSPRAGIVCGVAAGTTGWLVYLSGLAYVENGLLFFGLTATGCMLRAIRAEGGSDRPGPDSRAWLLLSGVMAGLACGCKYTAVAMIALPLGVIALCRARDSWRQRLSAGAMFAAGCTAAFSPWLIKNVVMTGNPVFPLANSVFRAAPPGWGHDETKSWQKGHAIKLSNANGGEDRSATAVRVTALWTHLLGDRHQRLGPLLFGLALIGLARRRRDRIDSVLLLLLIVQLGVWLFATQLLARFAVVVLIPLSLLCGRALGERAPSGETSVERPATPRRMAVVMALLIGAAGNFLFIRRLYAAETAAGLPASFIYDGELAGYEYFKTVNHDLSDDAKILLVGDAKAFYFKQRVDYCVVFNQSPFFAYAGRMNVPRIAGRPATADRRGVQWLREQGYTHVLVNWSELRRLASTYGFSPPVDPQQLEMLFDDLTRSGLTRLRTFTHPAVRGRYIELYEVGP